MLSRSNVVVVSWAPNRLELVSRSRASGLLHKSWDGSSWQPPNPDDWENLGGIFTSPPAVATWGPDRLDIFGLGTDRDMWHKSWDGSSWQPSQTDWEPLGGNFIPWW
jgi:hypothetical protein